MLTISRSSGEDVLSALTAYLDRYGDQLMSGASAWSHAQYASHWVNNCAVEMEAQLYNSPRSFWMRFDEGRHIGAPHLDRFFPVLQERRHYICSLVPSSTYQYGWKVLSSLRS